MIKVVIFDFDGVLVDSNEAWAEALGKAFEATGVDKKVTYDDIKPHYGKPYVEVFRGVHPKCRNDKDTLECMYKNFMEIAESDEFSDSMNTIKGTRRFLGQMKKKFRLAVGSGNSRRVLNRFLKKLKLEKYFEATVAGDEVRRGKPSPDLLLEAIRKLRVKPSEAVYVGDSESDIIAAKKAGVKSIAVLTGALDMKAAKKLKPDYIAEDVTKIQEALKCM